MKKYIVLAVMLLLSSNAHAQMNDMLGVLAVDGALTQGSYQGVGQMQQAYGRMQFQQDLAALNAQIQTTFMGNYNGISKEALLYFDGFRGLEWNVGSVSSNEYFVELSGLDGATCFLCKSPEWHARKTEINDGTDCQASNNRVKMYF